MKKPAMKRVRTWWHTLGHAPLILIAILLGLALVVAILDRTLEEPLRRAIERRMTERLVGYTARIGHVDFHPLGFGLDVEKLVITQNAHPSPPVLLIPKLAASVQWKALLFARLVADFKLENPSVYANLTQLQEEARDQVPFNEHGWQDAFQAIYPLKINELRVVNGSVFYQDQSDFRPLHATHVELLATNIRNIQSRERDYPSTLHAQGDLFDKGTFSIDGHADFLARPIPGVKVAVNLNQVQLDYFEPVVQRYNLKLRQGVMTAIGQIEHAAQVEIVDIDSILIENAAVDYVYSATPPPRVEAAAQRIKERAHEVMNDTQSHFRIQHLLLRNGTVGLINSDESPAYRLFVSNADFRLENLSSRVADGICRATLAGSFMGTGDVNGDATFFPEGKSANFHAKLKIAETQLAPMNDMLRAHGGFDVVGGIFSLYTDIRVREGYIQGYVKPMFRDINVYDPSQDRHKNIFRRFYEVLVGGIAKILENRRREEVATVASLSGPVSGKNTNAMQILGGLLKNAFIKAILPGFETELKRTDPLNYRAMKKRRERKAESPHRG